MALVTDKDPDPPPDEKFDDTFDILREADDPHPYLTAARIICSLTSHNRDAIATL